MYNDVSKRIECNKNWRKTATTKKSGGWLLDEKYGVGEGTKQGEGGTLLLPIFYAGINTYLQLIDCQCAILVFSIVMEKN